MSYSYTTTHSDTFTVTHARHIAVKIGTDLKRMQRFYGKPCDGDIQDYENEAIALLKGDYFDRIEYGFVSGGGWRVALRYEARHGGVLVADDDPGRIPRNVDVRGCHFTSFLYTNYRWKLLTSSQQEYVYAEAGVSFRRSPGNGYHGNWTYDRTYSAGGRGVVRSSNL